MAVSFHKFIDRLNRSGLLTTQQLQTMLSAAPKDKRPGDTRALSRWLVKEGHLTPFQAKAIYLGKTRGLVVGNYVILDLLGVGGMGQVYKAQHRRMQRIVALKLLAPEVARKPQLVQRFHQEVQAAARLMHPNIVAAFDADEADGKHFLVMEYVPGQDLASLVKQRGRLSVNRSIRCVLDAARGLEFAHQHGVVHRDVKPSNLLLTSAEQESAHDDGRSSCVKVLDMGLARIEAEAESVNTPSDLTRTGIVMGTVDYMSPEQAVNTHEADHRSDIYSLGIALHFLLIGDVPFRGRTLIEQVLAHREAGIPSLREARSGVPAGLDAIFRRMVAKKPEDRYQSMGEVVAALEEILSADESSTDLPILVDAGGDDSALVNFLDSMSGDATAQQQAAATVITPASEHLSPETFVASDRSTAVQRVMRRTSHHHSSLPWKAILLHATWSLGLLGIAVWMLWSSRHEPAAGPEPIDGHAAPLDANPEPADNVRLDRPLAEWTLSKGGAVSVADAARSVIVPAGQDLPRWELSITQITLPGAVLSETDLVRLADVTQLPLLRSLRLAGETVIDDTWMASLAPFPRLMELDLRGTSVTDETLQILPELCPMLEVLQLGNCAVSGSGLREIARLPMLRQLGLNQTALTSAALPALTSLSTLRELDVRQTALSAEQLQQLQEALPGCRIQGAQAPP